MCGKMKRLGLNSQARRAFQGRSRGFTLIEVLVAIGIMGIIAAAFLSGLATVSKTLILADERATAESLARSQMEYVKNQNYSTAPTGGVGNYTKLSNSTIPAGYTICSYDRTHPNPVNCGASDTVIGIPWNSETNQAEPVNDNGLQKIKLAIEHNGEIVITLEGYKRQSG
jgi:prepilin-type N-terminal cleavage/methylation domain-containing protein